jgi:resuscitation-promoting factor RpfB
MIAAFKAWFTALSTTAKVGVVSGAVITGGVANGAVTNSPSTQPVKQTIVAEGKVECVSTKSKVTEKEVIPFEKTTIDDSGAAKGKTYVKSAGANGEKTLNYELTTYNPSGCKADDKKLLETTITVQPVSEVIAIGTYEAPQKPVSQQANSCDTNYSGCVPLVSYDLDCADIGFRVTVYGTDKHRFDADHDGIGCESY